MKFKIEKHEFIPKKCKGLGDLVSIVAEPIKTTIIKYSPKIIADFMKNCNCNKRRELLNQMIPFKQ